ncbi:hypothetical protein CR152_32265 (plasmid) [Massilia violaceinigra]|uniref:DUF6531 domain-containing protein n=1 Tax=Massilia violaceinigra TaxID=2045208 RepID=A0A2D2DWF0_9BURK|nr:DUF6531 domain-containing protein [Massilia violaceinigra]ATQ79252.1 hypothetical protein CR152_32265 [Massilia violaceinigra]
MAFPFAGAPFLSRLSPHRIFFVLITAISLCVTLPARAAEPTPRPDTFGPYKYTIFGGSEDLDEAGAIKTAIARVKALDVNKDYCKINFVSPPSSIYGAEIVDADAMRGYSHKSISAYYYGVVNGVCVETIKLEPNPLPMKRWRLVCHAAKNYRYSAEEDKCVYFTPESNKDADGKNIGIGCPEAPGPTVGKPIQPATGNMWHIITDYQAPQSASSLTLSRFYNSAPTYPDPYVVRGFGVRWTHSYNKSLRPEKQYSNGSTCWRSPVDGSFDCSSGFQSDEPIPSRVSVSHPDGRQTMFTRSTNGNYTSSPDVCDRLSPVMAGDNLAVKEWILTSAQHDRTERFDAKGLLLSVTERSGLKQVFTYSDGVSNNTSVSHFPAAAPACANVHPDDVLPAGRLLCVTNNWGRQLQFRYDVKGRIAEMIDPAGKSTLYEYDGASGGCIPGNEASVACKANNLTKVTYPDGKSQTYWYNEASKIQINDDAECKLLTKTTGNGFGPTAFRNLMTGLVDENEDRHISWTYDCAGRATSSQLGEDIDKVTVAYVAKPDTGGPPLAIVTHYVGPKEKPVTSVSYFEKDYVQGVAKTTNIYAPCVECGSIAQRKYDAIGNVTMTKDFNGNYSCFQYEAGRNLETARVEGASTADCTSLLAAQTLASPARKTTTKWHAEFRLPETIAEPKRITKYQYDFKTGNITKTEQATTDLTGAQGVNAPLTGSVRKWAYAYDKGQLTTVTGPRSDIVDVTKYGYDSKTGDLITVTNAVGKATTYGSYDDHGRVHTIRAPDGVTTELAYTERGWVKSKIVSSGIDANKPPQTTTYAYTPSGQIEMVTFPDNSVTKYTYDAAHRLTSVVSGRDESLESIIYTLDLTGNRIKEEVRDHKGNLVRQITRTYDKTGRLTSQTGAAR